MRVTLRSLMTLAIATGVVVAAQGCMAFRRPPSDAAAFSRSRISEAGLYRATIKPAGDSIPKGKLQTWTLHLETVSGAPVDSAAITVDGGMPQHGHGLPTKPIVNSHLANGDHLVEGMKFNMGGWWVVRFHVAGAAGADKIVFNLKL